MLTDKDIKQFSVLAGQMNSALEAIALEKRILIPYYILVIGPVIGIIPDKVKSFNIINIGYNGENKLFSDISVTGIVSTTVISKHLKVFGYSIENDRNQIKGPISITPDVDHHIILQYLL